MYNQVHENKTTKFKDVPDLRVGKSRRPAFTYV